MTQRTIQGLLGKVNWDVRPASGIFPITDFYQFYLYGGLSRDMKYSLVEPRGTIFVVASKVDYIKSDTRSASRSA